MNHVHGKMSGQDLERKKGLLQTIHPPGHLRETNRKSGITIIHPFSTIHQTSEKEEKGSPNARSLARWKMQCKVKKSCVHRLMYNPFLILNQLPA